MTDAIPPTTASDAELVAEWRAAMEGVTPGEWVNVDRPATKFADGDGLIATAERTIGLGHQVAISVRPRLLDGARWQRTGDWIARCSPSGIASLLDRLDKLSAEVAAKDAVIAGLREALERVAKPTNPERLSGAHLTKAGRTQLAFAMIDNFQSIARASLTPRMEADNAG